MKPACWSHLLPDPLRMGHLSTDGLDGIERTAEREALTVAHGISWLIHSLATLTARLVDTASGAEHELERRKTSAPHPTAEG